MNSTWHGYVEDIKDPENKGRVKVRITGYYSPSSAVLPTEDLPWAIVVQNTNNPIINGKGETPYNLLPGTWVVGYFEDESMQQPVVSGTIFGKVNILSDIPELNSDPSRPGWEYLSNKETIPTTVEQITAKTGRFSISNPGGNGPVPVAQRDGSSPFLQFSADINNLFYATANAEVFEYDNIFTIGLTTKDQNIIRVNRTENLPRSGIIKIGNEIMSYNDKNDKFLLEVVRGIYDTEAVEHQKGSKITFPEREVNGRPKEIVSTITGKVLNFRKEVDRVINTIRNYIKKIVNDVKSVLTSFISDTIIKISGFLKSIFPFQTRVIISALYKILQKIECDFGLDFVESIVNKIKNFIENKLNELINQILNGVNSILNPVTQCLNYIFDNILSISLLIDDILDLIDSAVSTISAANNLANVATQTGELRNLASSAAAGAASLGASSPTGGLGGAGGGGATIGAGLGGNYRNAQIESQKFIDTVNTIGNSIGLLLNLLGIGCNKTTSPAKVDAFVTLNSGVKLDCIDPTQENGIGNPNARTYAAVGCGFTTKDVSLETLLKQYRRPIRELNKIISYG